MFSPLAINNTPRKGPAEMSNLKPLTTVVFAMLALVLFAPAKLATAQAPAYLHAISDLRQARDYVGTDNRPTFRGHLSEAANQITAAIKDLKVVVIDEGKNPDWTPPPQSTGDANGPVHAALRLLQEARDDVSRGRDAPENAGLRERSLDHIERARHELQSIINEQS